MHFSLFLATTVLFWNFAVGESKPKTDLSSLSQLYYNTSLGKYYALPGVYFYTNQQALPNASQIEVSVDEAPFKPFTSSVSFTTEGKHLLRVRALDGFRQVSSTQEVQFYIDGNPPETMPALNVDLITGTQILYLANAQALVLESTDTLSGVRKIEVSDDGKQFRSYDPAIPIAKIGKHKVYFRATDNLGNTENTKSIEYVLAEAPPATKVQTNPLPFETDKALFIGEHTLVSFSVKGNQIPIKETLVKMKDKSFAYSKPFALTRPGEQTLHFYSRDLVGNTEREQSATLILDSVSPKTLATPEGEFIRVGNLLYSGAGFGLRLDAEDLGSGTRRVEYRMNHEPSLVTYKGPLSFQNEGFQTIYFRALDNVGNSEPFQEFSFVVDRTAPKTTARGMRPFMEKNGKILSPTPNALIVNAEDNLAGVKTIFVSLNNLPFIPYSGPIELERTGQNKIVYKSVDTLGNEEKPHTLIVEMSDASQTIPLISGHGTVDKRTPASKKR